MRDSYLSPVPDTPQAFYVLFLDVSLSVLALALYRKPQESHIVTIPTSINGLLFHFMVPQNLLYPAENIECLKPHLGSCNFKHKTCQYVILTHIKKDKVNPGLKG